MPTAIRDFDVHAHLVSLATSSWLTGQIGQEICDPRLKNRICIASCSVVEECTCTQLDRAAAATPKPLPKRIAFLALKGAFIAASSQARYLLSGSRTTHRCKTRGKTPEAHSRLNPSDGLNTHGTGIAWHFLSSNIEVAIPVRSSRWCMQQVGTA